MKRPRLRDFSLGIRLWLLFIGFVIPCILLLSLSFKFVLDGARDQEMFMRIRQAQDALQSAGASSSSGVQEHDADMPFAVYDIGIVDRKVKYMTLPDNRFQGLLTPLLSVMGASFGKQKADSASYKQEINGYALYYIIRKNQDSGVISFMVDVPFDSAYRTAFYVMLGFSAAAVVLAMLFSLLFLKAVTRPLKRLQKSIASMAGGDLHTPVEVDRTDEIGMLSREMEKTRVQLANRDVLRQSAVQYVSHELKTPVMTIVSYARAMLDHVYPQGGPEGSAKVIAAQARRLQQLVLKLLAVTKLDYMESRPPVRREIDLAELTEDICMSAAAARPDLAAELDLPRTPLHGDPEQLRVLLENLLENAFRHADKTVRAAVGTQEERPFFTVFNDGGGIPPEQLPTLFDAFKKGRGGVAGLGLAIVKRVCDAAGAEITVENRDGGVAFTVRFREEDG